MPVEIERKFLVKGEFKQLSYKQEQITQAYLSTDPERSVRIRRKGEKAFLTFKGKSYNSGKSRFEWEREITCPDAEQLFVLCIPGTFIDKTRYFIQWNKHIIEVDEFHGENEGLILAEVELSDENENFDIPEWFGMEVTGDIRYYNSQLAQYPYSKWKDHDRDQGKNT